MKTMFIYEPAMCCETGLCGVGVDSELLRISTVISTLKNKGVKIQRFNLTNAPNEFVKNLKINKLIMNEGVEVLPVTMLEEEIVKTGEYPSNREIANMLQLSESVLQL